MELLAIVFLCACGGSSGNAGPGSGGGSGGGTPGFSLSISPGAVSVPAGGTQAISVSIMPQASFSGKVHVTVSGLPSTAVVSPNSLDLGSTGSGSFYIGTYTNASPSQNQVTITGTSGTQTARVTASFAIGTAATGPPAQFQILGGEAERAFYDETRQLIFVTNRWLNEVDVLSGNTLFVQRRIPIPEPLGIDQMADLQTIVVGTDTQGLYTIDENTFNVTRHLCPQFPNTFFNATNVLVNPVAMANGKVLIASDYGFLGGDYVFSGALIEWDSMTDTFAELASPQQSGTPFSGSKLARSADHQWALFAAGQLYLYSSATDQFAPSSFVANASDVAANPNGSQFAVLGNQGVTFYDRNFQVLGAVAPTIPDQALNAQYSSDGTRLYWGDYTNNVIDVLDAVHFSEIGNVTAYFGQFSTAVTQYPSYSFLFVDSNQRALIPASGGVGMVDCSTPNPQAPNGHGGGFGVGNPYAIPINTITPVSFINNYVQPGTSVFVGGVPVNFQSGNPTILIPPLSALPGPVDVVEQFSDGRLYYSPQVLSYGVDIVGANANLLPPSGNPGLTISGFGLYNDPFSAGAVSVNGQAGTNSVVNANSGIINALQQVYFNIPNGVSGPVNVQVTSNQGTGVLGGSLSYIPQATIVPATGILQLLYDPQRNLLYALTNTQVQVFDPVNLNWKSPIIPGGTGGTGYVSMALTPDNSRLLIADSVKNVLTVVDPSNPSQQTNISLPYAPSGNLAATANGKVFVSGTNYEVDLSTQSARIRNDFPPNQYAATPDGSVVVGSQCSNIGSVCIWDSATDTFASQGLLGGGDVIFGTDIAIAPDGSTFTTLFGLPGLAGVFTGIFDQQLHMVSTTAYPDLVQPDATQVLGAQYTASGHTLVVPYGDSIDFFDVSTGVLKGRVITPEALPVLVFPVRARGNVALSPDDQTIYTISASGLTVMQLGTPIDNLAPPAFFAASAARPIGPASAKTALSSALARNKPGRKGASVGPLR